MREDMKLSDKLISVIVPVYLTERYLRNCIESILTQTYKNLEIILIEDGSPDNCAGICDEYSEKDNRVKVIHQGNGGLSCARNAGIDYAHGEYLAFVDSDDTINSEFIEILYKLCEENNCEIAQCDFLFVSEDSIKLGKQSKADSTVISGKEAVGKCCRQPGAVKYNVAWNKLYKKELFHNIRYPDGKVHEDEYTTYRLFWNAKKVAVTGYYLYWYLQRNDSITGKKFNINRLDRLEAYEQRLDFLKKNEMDKEYSAFLTVYYHALWSSFENIERDLADCEEILESLQRKADAVCEEILHRPGRSFLDNLRVVFSHLPEEEKSRFRSLYGSDAANARIEAFLFPFGEIPVKSRIAIYGAGGVGKTFFKQAVSTRYADVVAWVDAMWRDPASKGFPVHPIDSLLQADFDYVILALRNEKVALEVRDNLVDWGIPAHKIIWHNAVQISPAEAVLIRDALQQTGRVKKTEKRRIFLMNTPDHGNLGDHALAIAANRFFQEFFPRYEVLEYTGKQWDYCGREISEIVESKDMIFFVGGGYMGDMWQKESVRVRQIIAQFPYNKKIFLPQSFYYQDKDFESDRGFYSAQNNILYIHREHHSYESFMKNIVPANKVNWLYPDMVLYMAVSIPKTKRKGIKLCMRTDQEQIVDGGFSECIRQICEELNISDSRIDTVIPKNVRVEEREAEVIRMLSKVSESRLLITDRLHGMLFAAMTGTPCIALDNVTKKVSGVYQWISDIPYIRVIESKDFDKEVFLSLYEMQDVDLNIEEIRKQFAQMAKQIQEWVHQ